LAFISGEIILFPCCICQKEVLPQFIYLCRGCEEAYGLNPVDTTDWPEWAKSSYSEERHRQYRDAIHNEYEIPFADCPEAEILAYGEL